MVQSPTPKWSDAEQAAQWENEGGHLQAPPSLEELGITRMLTESFAVGGYRYTTLADAVAQAKRMTAKAARIAGGLPEGAPLSSQPEMA
jgi:hypothetical protein